MAKGQVQGQGHDIKILLTIPGFLLCLPSPLPLPTEHILV